MEARAQQLQPFEPEASLSSLHLLVQRGWILYVAPTSQTRKQVGTGQDSAAVSVLFLPMEITSVIGDRRWARPPALSLPARSLRAPEGLAPYTPCTGGQALSACFARAYSLPSALRTDQYIPQQGIYGPASLKTPV